MLSDCQSMQPCSLIHACILITVCRKMGESESKIGRFTKHESKAKQAGKKEILSRSIEASFSSQNRRGTTYLMIAIQSRLYFKAELVTANKRVRLISNIESGTRVIQRNIHPLPSSSAVQKHSQFLVALQHPDLLTRRTSTLHEPGTFTTFPQ